MRDIAAAPRAPGVAGGVAVLFGHDVAQHLEGITLFAEMAGALGDEFEIARVDLGADLGAFEVLQLGGELVDALARAALLIP